MIPSELRRRAFDAQGRAAKVADGAVQAELMRVAEEWLAMADVMESLERRFGPLVRGESSPSDHPVAASAPAPDAKTARQ